MLYLIKSQNCPWYLEKVKQPSQATTSWVWECPTIAIFRWLLIKHIKCSRDASEFRLSSDFWAKSLARLVRFFKKLILKKLSKWAYRFYSSRQTHMYPWVYGLANQNRSKFAIEIELKACHRRSWLNSAGDYLLRFDEFFCSIFFSIFYFNFGFFAVSKCF